MSNEIPKGPQKRQPKRQIPPNTRKQGLPPQGGPFSAPRQQAKAFNTRGRNTNVVQSEHLKKIRTVIQTMGGNITALRKENAELKAKLAQAQKKP